MHLPYHESDHVLNIACNLLCGGKTLEDLEQRRQDEVYLDALGAKVIPDPTTAGFKMIVNGELDELPEQAFYMKGGIEEAQEAAEKMAAAV